MSKVLSQFISIIKNKLESNYVFNPTLTTQHHFELA